ncbi:MAG: hypothetical protein ACTS3F_11315 [Phycisphaerales bacterium]
MMPTKAMLSNHARRAAAKATTAITILLALTASASAQVIINEDEDFADFATFNPLTADYLGPLAQGKTTINAGLDGIAIDGDANPGTAGDTQDSILFDIAAGDQLVSLGIETTEGEFEGFDALSIWITIYKDDFQTIVFDEGGALAWSESFDLLLPALTEGSYSLSLYGGSASAGPAPGTGDYAFDYALSLSVAQIPTPTTTAPLALGAATTLTTRRRRRQ